MCVPQQPGLAAAVTPLAPTLTHLSLHTWTAADSQTLEVLCKALPQLRSLSLTSWPLPAVSPQLLLHPSLCQLLLTGHASSAAWVQQLLDACKAASAAALPQGSLVVQLPHLQEAELAGAQQLWEQLAARNTGGWASRLRGQALLGARGAAAASRVVVTDGKGRDLLECARLARLETAFLAWLAISEGFQSHRHEKKEP
jgi:hypothetical protein